MGRDADQLLFSYGTLRARDVQLDVFGRAPDSDPDVLAGHRLGYVEDRPVVRRTDDPLDRVVGAVLALTMDELDAADEYELGCCRRRAATLASGRRAWVYVDETVPAGAD